MKLLLDELYSDLIAKELRKHGHDVISVLERADLKGRSDQELFPLAASEQRAIVTENWADYQREMQRAASEGEVHYGVLFTSRQRMPRSKNTIGLFVEVLDDFLARHQPIDALMNSYRWLPDR